MPAATKGAMRQELIERRQGLDGDRRRRADAAIVGEVLALADHLDAQTLAAFVAHRGEPDLMPALSGLHADGCSVCLPVVRGSEMHFRPWSPRVEMRRNRFGIPEPVGAEEVAPGALDLVLMPMVGFAADGARLGMGAGFYDRALAFRRGLPDAAPRLIGVAYAVQEVESLPTDEWDVPLDGVITEAGLRWF